MPNKFDTRELLRVVYSMPSGKAQELARRLSDLLAPGGPVEQKLDMIPIPERFDSRNNINYVLEGFKRPEEQVRLLINCIVSNTGIPEAADLLKEFDEHLYQEAVDNTEHGIPPF